MGSKHGSHTRSGEFYKLIYSHKYHTYLHSKYVSMKNITQTASPLEWTRTGEKDSRKVTRGADETGLESTHAGNIDVRTECKASLPSDSDEKALTAHHRRDRPAEAGVGRIARAIDVKVTI